MVYPIQRSSDQHYFRKHQEYINCTHSLVPSEIFCLNEQILKCCSSVSATQKKGCSCSWLFTSFHNSPRLARFIGFFTVGWSQTAIQWQRCPQSHRGGLITGMLSLMNRIVLAKGSIRGDGVIMLGHAQKSLQTLWYSGFRLHPNASNAEDQAACGRVWHSEAILWVIAQTWWRVFGLKVSHETRQAKQEGLAIRCPVLPQATPTKHTTKHRTTHMPLSAWEQRQPQWRIRSTLPKPFYAIAPQTALASVPGPR